MNNKLFEDFPPVSAKAWKQKIQFDLNGADYNNTLVWHSNEDITVKPFYHADDVKIAHGTSNTKATQWKICQAIFVFDVEKSNLKALDLLNNGVEVIKFIIPSENVSIKKLLQNIDALTLIHFELQFLSVSFTKDILKVFPNAKILTDIIGNLTHSGNWHSNLKEDFKAFETISKTTKSISIDITQYQNAGANIIQELAYAIAHANEYLNQIDEIFTSELKQNLSINFQVAIGSNYFFEIAKLRALRMLWKTVAEAYNVNTTCHIIATPTKRNKTLYDYNTNMLRTTTECMSAVLGGANTICNLAYDAIYHKSNDFGERISRNQLLILKYESYFNKVNNPTDGAYYIENLTKQFTEKALDLFKNIEKSGGFLHQIKTGTIQRKIKDSSKKEQDQFDSGELILLGTNKHPNLNDKMKNELELYPFVKTTLRKTLIEPIIEKRLAEKLEQTRLKQE